MFRVNYFPPEYFPRGYFGPEFEAEVELVVTGEISLDGARRLKDGALGVEVKAGDLVVVPLVVVAEAVAKAGTVGAGAVCPIGTQTAVAATPKAGAGAGDHAGQLEAAVVKAGRCEVLRPAGVATLVKAGAVAGEKAGTMEEAA